MSLLVIFGAYRIVEKLRLMRTDANAQTQQGFATAAPVLWGLHLCTQNQKKIGGGHFT